MSAVLGVWLSGVAVVMGLAACAALGEAAWGERPRVVAGNLAYRSGIALLWPVAGPAWVIRAIVRDRW